MKKLQKVLAMVAICGVSFSLTDIPVNAYVRFEGTAPDTTGKTLFLSMIQQNPVITLDWSSLEAQFFHCS